jgi:hypothetical protein
LIFSNTRWNPGYIKLTVKKLNCLRRFYYLLRGVDKKTYEKQKPIPGRFYDRNSADDEGDSSILTYLAFNSIKSKKLTSRSTSC